MGIRFSVITCIAVALSIGFAHAEDITYVAHYDISSRPDDHESGTYLNVSITTDGAIGSLQQSDIVSFIATSDNFYDSSFTSDDGTDYLSGLYANSTALYLVGQDSGFYLSQNPLANPYNDPSDYPYFYGDAVDFVDYPSCYFCSSSTVFVTGYDEGLHSNTQFAAINPRDIASINGNLTYSAPEPSSWALMVLGVGLAGIGLRYGRRSTAVNA